MSAPAHAEAAADLHRSKKRLHPDNRGFAFSVDEGSRTELWVLETFLPAKTGK